MSSVHAKQIAKVLPDDWSIRPFEELVFFQEGPGIRNWQYVPKGIPFVNIRCLVDGRLNRAAMSHVSGDEAFGKYRHFLLDKDDYVVSSSGTLGRIATVNVTDLPCMLNTSVIRMRPKNDNIDRVFLKYFLISDYYQSQILSLATGSAQLNYGPMHLRQMFIVAPPIDEQRAIAHILGTLDDKIELNRRSNETLEAMARALFKDWFVDFGPVRAKRDGREPYLTSELWSLFPDKLDEADIPAGWHLIELDKFASLLTTSVSPGKFPTTVFEHYSIPAFDAGHSPVFELGDAIKSNKFMVDRHAVLVSKLNPQTPRVWMPTIATDHSVCSTEFMQFVPLQPENRAFLYLLMTADAMQAEILKRVTGSTGSRQRAQPSQIAVLPIIQADGKVLKAFNRLVGPLLDSIARNHLEQQTLATIRDTLLPKLLSGELRVRDAEAVL